jgi:hypothetical protein
MFMSSFKQKALFAAIAGASALGMSGTSSAVYVNSDGLGQALVYPYYTTRNGIFSTISVVNTTDLPKAVKVRFLDGKNSAEVLDFNLFLSPRDVWTGAIIPSGAGSQITTTDKSCTNPKIGSSSRTTPQGGEPFRNFQFISDGDVTALQTLDRTNEGYVEILEMATIISGSALADDVTHVNGVPACKLVSDASFTTSQSLTAPTGGLFGNVNFISPAGGYASSVDATAWDGWSNISFPTSSGNIAPNLASGSSAVAVVNNNGNIYVSTFGLPRDAVSATIMHSRVSGEYAFTSDGVFATDWVMTMPTKRPYVNRPVVLPPFQSVWNRTTGVSCDGVALLSTDREEFRATTQDDFSPPPPNAPGNAICYEANVIGFGGLNAAGASGVLGSKNVAGLTPIQNAGSAQVPIGREGGWLALSFTNTAAQLGASSGTTISTINATPTTTPAVHTYFGLPVIGFSATTVVTTAKLNYSTVAGLRFNRTITP